jgi:hypothetical protein
MILRIFLTGGEILAQIIFLRRALFLEVTSGLQSVFQACEQKIEPS